MANEEQLEVQALGGIQAVPLHVPAEGAVKAILACLPAIGIRAAYYKGFAEALADGGIAAALVELPGQRTSPIRADRGTQWGYGDVVTSQLAPIRRALRVRFPDRPFLWMGHFLGGQLGLMDGGLAPDEVQGAALIASGTPYHRGWPGLASLRILGASQVVGAVATALGFFPGEKVGFGGREAGRMMREWSRVARSGSYRFSGFDGDDAFARFTAPVLAINFEGDPLAPWGSTEHLIAKTGASEIERATLSTRFGTASHNKWPREPTDPAARVATWVEQTILS